MDHSVTRDPRVDEEQNLYAKTPALQTVKGVTRLGHDEKLVLYEVKREDGLDEVYAVIHREESESRYIFAILDDEEDPDPLVTFDRYTWYEYEGAVPITSDDGVYPVPAAVVSLVGRAGYDLELAFG